MTISSNGPFIFKQLWDYLRLVSLVWLCVRKILCGCWASQRWGTSFLLNPGCKCSTQKEPYLQADHGGCQVENHHQHQNAPNVHWKDRLFSHQSPFLIWDFAELSKTANNDFFCSNARVTRTNFFILHCLPCYHTKAANFVTDKTVKKSP